MTSIKHQQTTFNACGGVLLGLRTVCQWSAGDNPSRACLVFFGALGPSAPWVHRPGHSPLILDGHDRILDEKGVFGNARIAASFTVRGLAGTGSGRCSRKPSRLVRSLVKAPSRMVKDFRVSSTEQLHPFWTPRLSPSAFRAGPALMAVAPGHHLPKCARSIRPDPVQNPSGVCQGSETARRPTLTHPLRNKSQTPSLHGFRLMPVLLFVKVWSKWPEL